MPAILLYEFLPNESLVFSLWYVTKCVGAWIAVALLIYIVNYVFFGTLWVLGRWIRSSFYQNLSR